MNEIPIRDIHLPDGALWWPPAPGWWLLLIVLVLLVVAWRFFSYWRKHRSFRTLALREYKAVCTGFEQHQDQRQLLANLSTLLRRTAMTYQGRQATASLTGDDWISQLHRLSGENCFTPEQAQLLIDGQFRRELEFDADDLFNSCQRWIKALPRSRKHVSA